MAKFTVFFKDSPIRTETFDSGIIYIGRDEINHVTLDSLAVAPVHAAVILGEKVNTIKQLNDDFPVVVNQIPTQKGALNSGDIITLGKHTIVFSLGDSNVTAPKPTQAEAETKTETALDKTPDKPLKLNQAGRDLHSLNKVLKSEINLPDGNLQVMEGTHIGRIIPLKKAMTRLGHSGSGGIVIITRRKDGYYISALEANNTLKVNGNPIGDTTAKLNNNDYVVIDNVKMTFFQ